MPSQRQVVHNRARYNKLGKTGLIFMYGCERTSETLSVCINGKIYL